MTIRIGRRQFVAALGGAGVAWPLGARAQQPGGMRRIGVLIAAAEDDPGQKARTAGFRQGLEQLGWLDGRNIRIDYRFAAGRADRFQPLAKELIALQPDVIFVASGPTAVAVQKETRSIPVVFVSTSDPIGFGLVESLARPGGNFTGFLLYEASITSKWLAMLKEIAPKLTRVAILGNPRTVPYDYYLRAAETFAGALAIKLTPVRVGSSADIERSIESFARESDAGLMPLADTTINVNRDLIVALAAKYRLPAVYTARDYVTAGGLMSYDTDRPDMYRRAASYIDRILRGANPADLPVQAPTRYETVINLKTAKALGLTVPPGLMVAADEVIE